MLDTPAGKFPETRMSLVEVLARPGEEGHKQAWERFFKGYWPPLFRYLRRTGSDRDQALDLLQDFFIAGRGALLERYDPQKGRLRSYLLACLKNLRRKDWRKKKARPDKLPWLDAAGEEATRFEPAAADPDEAFDAEWTRQIHARAIAALRERLHELGDERSLALLERWVLNVSRPPAAELAKELGWSSANLYTRATRMRNALVAEAEGQIRLLETDAAAVGHERDAVLRLFMEEGK